MNAQIHAAASQRNPIPAETRQERALRAAISVHCPNQDEMTMAARVDIALMRDRASAGIAKASDSAAVLLGEVSRLAAQAVYANIPTSRLLRARSALMLTMEAARALELAAR